MNSVFEKIWEDSFSHARDVVEGTANRGGDGDFKMAFAVFEMAGVVKESLGGHPECPEELRGKMTSDISALERVLNFHRYIGETG